MSDVLRSLARPDALAAMVVSGWGVPVERVVLHRTLANDVYRVDPGHFLKVYRHDWRTPDEVAWEVDLVTHLIAAGIPVPAVAERVGVWEAPEGPRALLLIERIDGRPPEYPFPPALHRAHGRLVARLHEAGTTFRSSHARPVADLARLFDEPLEAVLPVLDADDRSRARALAASARQRLAGDPPSWGLCHGDASMDNVLVTADGLVLFDFDLAGEGYLATDLPFGVENFADFIDGYREIRALTPTDLAAEPWIEAARVLDALRFHLVTKPTWYGIAPADGGEWAESALTDLRSVT